MKPIRYITRTDSSLTIWPGVAYAGPRAERAIYAYFRERACGATTRIDILDAEHVDYELPDHDIYDHIPWPATQP